MTIHEKAFGPAHSDMAATLNTLAELYYAQGKYAQAEPLLQRALAIREKALRNLSTRMTAGSRVHCSTGLLSGCTDVAGRTDTSAVNELVYARSATIKRTARH